jgi:hypothetical protein
MRSPSDAQYIREGKTSVDRDVFENGLSDFVTKTIDRLELMERRSTELQNLWLEVEKERRDPDGNLYRIIEASLGFNPDEGPEQLIDVLADKMDVAGFQPILEIAAASSVEVVANPYEEATSIINVNGRGLPANFDCGRFQPEKVDLKKAKPWEAGQAMARNLRSYLGYGNAPIDNVQLASLFGLRSQALTGEDVSLKNLSLGAPDETNPNHLKIHFHQKHLTGRRFCLARILGERLLNADQPTNWLPATFGLTWRQKYQRAFASEFLCPFQALEEKLAKANPDDDDIFAPLAKMYLMDEYRLEKHWRRNKSDLDDWLTSL